MRLNADFSQRVVVRPADYRWVASPMPGVERMMLDRIGDQGALIFVKLHQFAADDHRQFTINTRNSEWSQGLVPGLKVLNLHGFGAEQVALVRWAPDTQFSTHTHWGGEEIFVIDGVFHDGHGEYPAGTWIRSPHRSSHTPFTRREGALIYVKVGHLPE